MKRYVGAALIFAALAGCAGVDGKTFSVLFQPFSVTLDPPAQQSVHAAAAFAKAHPLMPLSIAGDATRPDPAEIPTLRQEQVAVVKDELIRQGVDQLRIEVLGTGILYPDGVPDQPAGRVFINVGL